MDVLFSACAAGDRPLIFCAVQLDLSDKLHFYYSLLVSIDL